MTTHHHPRTPRSCGEQASEKADPLAAEEKWIILCLEALAILALLVGLSATPTVEASTEFKGQTTDNGNAEDTIGGLLIDRTQTRTGHDFYQAFCDFWRDQTVTLKYNLVIVERPSAREGSRIRIDYNNQTIFKTVLFPGRGDIRDQGKQAASHVAEILRFWELQQLQAETPDLAANEI